MPGSAGLAHRLQTKPLLNVLRSSVCPSPPGFNAQCSFASVEQRWLVWLCSFLFLCDVSRNFTLNKVPLYKKCLSVRVVGRDSFALPARCSIFIHILLVYMNSPWKEPKQPGTKAIEDVSLVVGRCAFIGGC